MPYQLVPISDTERLFISNYVRNERHYIQIEVEKLIKEDLWETIPKFPRNIKVYYDCNFEYEVLFSFAPGANSEPNDALFRFTACDGQEFFIYRSEELLLRLDFIVPDPYVQVTRPTTN